GGLPLRRAARPARRTARHRLGPCCLPRGAGTVCRDRPEGPMKTTPSLTLNNGVRIPAVGLGMYRVDPTEAADTVTAALETGYRLVDTAASYGNERGVGEAVRRT